MTQFPKTKIPIASRNINWLSNSAKIAVKFDKDTTATFDLLRQIRNNFVHENKRGLPRQMVKRAEKLKQEALEQELEENEHFVWKAFETISKAIKIVERAVIEHYHSTIHKDLA